MEQLSAGANARIEILVSEGQREPRQRRVEADGRGEIGGPELRDDVGYLHVVSKEPGHSRSCSGVRARRITDGPGGRAECRENGCGVAEIRYDRLRSRGAQSIGEGAGCNADEWQA